jgi:glycosyltransferase involved in cell wall biosynthesis
MILEKNVMNSPEEMTISVIVPCRNEKCYIGEFLHTLFAQELEPGWQLEVLVADGLSDDGTRDIFRRYAEVQVIDNPGRIVSTGLNAAIAAASGEVIVRMDVHTRYAPDYIRQCVYVLRETGADNVGGPWVAQGRGLVGNAIAAAFQSRFCTGGGKAHDPAYEGEVDTVYLGCWTRSAFDKAGLFDPGLVRNQDDEFNFRLRRLGGRIWQSTRIKSSYEPRNSLSALFRQYLQYGFWKVAVIRKHRSLAAWRHLVPALLVSSILIWLVAFTFAAVLRMHQAAVATGAALETELAIYVLACVAAAGRFARTVDPRVLLLVPGVMAVFHFAYGLGFLIGVLKPADRRSSEEAQYSLFTELTR